MRRSCHTIARRYGSPVVRSHATTVSRWLVMPIAATVAAPTSSSTSVSVALIRRQISSASCSTQPGRGKCWVNSRYEATPGRRPSEWRRSGSRWSRRRSRRRRSWHRRFHQTTRRDCVAKLFRRSASTIDLVGVGILTGGGDCPGLNAVLRAVCRKGERFHGDEIIGFKARRDGVRTGRTMPLTIDVMRGSCRGAGRCSEPSGGARSTTPDGVEEVKRTFNDLGIDALIVVGGNGSLTVANALVEEEGLPIVGVPKTIDNDVVGTDLTFGFHTAVQIATEAIDRLHTTAESHDRVMVVEVMGRHSGVDRRLRRDRRRGERGARSRRSRSTSRRCATSSRRHEKGRYASIVVVAEGAEPIPGTLQVNERVYDEFGHVRLGGIADVIAREVGDRTGFETRVVMLGHVQRGGTPTAFDRVLSTRFGVAAIDLVHEHAWGQMVALRTGDRRQSARRHRRAHQAARHVPLPRRRRDLLLVGARRSAGLRPATNHCRRRGSGGSRPLPRTPAHRRGLRRRRGGRRRRRRRCRRPPWSSSPGMSSSRGASWSSTTAPRWSGSEIPGTPAAPTRRSR